jgi:hypothetical protein
VSEKETVNAVRATLSHGDTRLFRNNVGALQDKTGRFVTYGLAVGSSDLIGWKSMNITLDMVGEKVAVFVALEGKSEDKAPTEAQRRFLQTVKDAGGIAGVFRSQSDAEHLLGKRIE